MKFDSLIRGGQVVTADKGVARCDIAIADGRISALLEDSSNAQAAEVVDVTGKYVLPGLVDPHTHLGVVNGIDDFTSETRSAAIGGITTVCSFFRDYERWQEYPSLLHELLGELPVRICVDMAIHVVVVARSHLRLIPRFHKAYGITSYKLYLSHRGEESRRLGFPPLDDGVLYKLLEEVGQVPGGVLAVHAENTEIISLLRRRLLKEGRDDLAAWTESRPDFVEAESIQRALHYARVTNCPLYLLHTTARASLDVVRNHRQRFSNPVYVETCPHYLTHTMYDQIGSVGKVNPPLRTAADAEACWEAIADGTVDTIGTDHVPRRKAAKQRGIWNGAAGFPGVATVLPLLLSEGVHRRGLSLRRVAEITSTNPARAYGLYPRKGAIAVGSDADLTVVDLDLELPVRPEELGSYSDYSLYEGRVFKGWPIRTILRGTTVMLDRAFVGRPGLGVYLPRGLPVETAVEHAGPKTQPARR